MDKFIAPYESLLGAIAARRDQIRAETQHVTARLHSQRSLVDATLAEMAAEDVVARIWRRDHTVWRPDPAEIADRLGWLDCARAMRDSYGPDDPTAADAGHVVDWSATGGIRGLVDSAQAEGYTDVLLLGMGGSSLAPELFGALWGSEAGGLYADGAGQHGSRRHPREGRRAGPGAHPGRDLHQVRRHRRDAHAVSVLPRPGEPGPVRERGRRALRGDHRLRQFAGGSGAGA